MAIFRDEMPHTTAIEVQYGYYMAIASVIFFLLVNTSVSYFGPPRSIRTDFWRWKKVLVSWIHALICAVWVLASFYRFPEAHEDLLLDANYFQYYLVAFSTGYFIYDFCTILYNNKVFMMFGICLHHLTILTVFWYHLHSLIGIALSMYILLAEVNTFFLHSRKLLQMAQVEYNHWFYRLVTVFNIITFIIFRGIALTVVNAGIFHLYHRVTFWYFLTLSSSSLIMDIYHLNLFLKLLKSDFLNKTPNAKTKQ